MFGFRHVMGAWAFSIFLVWGSATDAEAAAASDDNPLRVLVWGEVEGADAPLTDDLRTMGYWAVAGTDDWMLYNDILQSFFGVDILVIRAGHANHLPNSAGGPTYWDLWEYVAVGGGTVIIEDPGETGEISFFSDISSPDVSVSVASTNDAGSITSIDQASDCNMISLIADYLPSITNSTKPVDMGSGWSTVASAGAGVGMAVAPVGRGWAIYLPTSLGEEAGAYGKNFINQMLNCVGRDPVEVSSQEEILLYQPDFTIRTNTSRRLADLGFQVTSSGDADVLSRAWTANYETVIIGRSQDPENPEYSAYIDDLRAYVRYGGTVLLESPAAVGSVALFPSDSYGDYSVTISSVSNTTSSAANRRFVQTYELTNTDFPKSREALSSTGGKWTKLLQRAGTSTGVLLWANYYGGHWAYLGANLDGFFADTKNANSNEFVARLLNQCLRPYRPLEDIAYVVADVEPASLINAVESGVPSIEKSTYIDTRTSNTTMVTLGKYDAVVAFSYADWATPESPDGRFKDYVDRYNRGVVLCGRAFDNGTGRELVGGGFGTAYSPFNPVDDQNVQYRDYAVAGDFSHNLLYGISNANLATIYDRYRARVNARNGAGIGVALWDNTPTSICADTSKTMALGQGLTYNPGTTRLIAPAIVLGDTSAWQFVSVTPTANGGEPSTFGAFAPGASSTVPTGLTVGAGYYWYTCVDTLTSLGTLYKLSSLVGPGNVVDSLALDYEPGDCAYDGSFVWITRPASNSASYYRTTSFAEMGTLDLSAFGQLHPGGLAISASASGPDTMYVAGNRGSYTYQTVLVITDPAGEFGSPAAIDSFPASGYEAAGLALEMPGSAPRTLWSGYAETGSPPYAGRNKICSFSPSAASTGSGLGDGLGPERELMMAAINTGNNCAGLNFYPGDSDDELGDGNSKAYAHKMVVNALKQVSMNPRGDDPEIRLGDHPVAIEREDLLSWFVSLHNTSDSDISIKFRIRATRPSGTDETLSPFGDPEFTIGAWEKRSGKVSLYVPAAITEGEWRITCYTLDSGSLIWNDKEAFEVTVANNVTFPADHSSFSTPEPRFDIERITRARPDAPGYLRDSEIRPHRGRLSRAALEALANAEEDGRPVLFLELDPR